MNSKKYIAGLALAGAIVSLASVVPAFADTNVGVNANINSSIHTNLNGQKGSDNDRDDKGGLRMMMQGERPALMGKVTAVSGTTLTVTGRGFGQNASTTYTVNASGASVFKDTATSTVSSIAVGDNILVIGTVSGSSVTATKIFDGKVMQRIGDKMASSTRPVIQGNGQPIVAGTVASVSGSTFTVTNNGSTTYTVDASNAKVEIKGNTSATVSNIAVGDKVVVQGAVSGTSITASSVIDQSASVNGDNGKHLGFFQGIGNFFKHLFGF